MTYNRAADLLRSVGAACGSPTRFVAGVLRPQQLLEARADRFEGVRVVRVWRAARLLEERPLAEHAAPFRVRLADQFLQQVLRAENPADVALQRREGAVEVVEQEVAFLHVPGQDARQHARGVR